MDEATILRIFGEPSWSSHKIEEAARGKVIGSCADTPEIELAFWLNLARDRAARHGHLIEEAEKNVLEQARRGEFG